MRVNVTTGFFAHSAQLHCLWFSIQIVAVLAMLFIWRNRRTTVIAESCEEMILVVFFGVVISLLSSLTLVSVPNSFSCNAGFQAVHSMFYLLLTLHTLSFTARALFHVGSTIAYGGLFVKVNQQYRVHSSAAKEGQRTTYTSTKAQLIIILVITLFQVLFFILFN